MNVLHIEKKARDVEAAAAAARPFVVQRVGREITAADIAAASGIPLDLAEPALLRLASEVPTRVRVRGAGVLLFTFERAPAAPRVAWWRRWWRANRGIVADVGAWFVVLVLVIGIGDALRVIGQAEGIEPVRVIGVLIGVLAALPVALTGVGFLLGGYGVVEGVSALWTKPFPQSLLLLFASFLLSALLFGGYFMVLRGLFRWSGGIGLFKQVRGFMLGPASEVADPLADERRVTALIRARGGIVATHDFARLFGCDLAQADRNLARILCDYGGDVLVTDAGAVLFRFDALLETAGPAASVPEPEPAWRAPPPAPRFFGCGRGFLGLASVIGIGSLVLAAARPDLPPFPTLDDVKQVLRRDALEALGAVGAWPCALALTILGLRVAPHARRLRRHREQVRLLAHLALVDGSGPLVGQPLHRVDARLLAQVGGTMGEVAEAPEAITFPEASLAAREATALRAPRPPAVGDRMA
jgi:hypothetical protein